MARNVIKAVPSTIPTAADSILRRRRCSSSICRTISCRRKAISRAKGYDLTPLRAILPAVNRVIEAARAADVSSSIPGKVIAQTWPTWPARSRERKRTPQGTGLLVRGSPGFEIVPEIKVRASDVIIDKTANGAFTYTELEPVLRAQGITNLCSPGARRMCACIPPCAKRSTVISSAC